MEEDWTSFAGRLFPEHKRVLARRPGETVVIGNKLFVSLTCIHPNAVDLSIYDSLVRVHSTVRVEQGKTVPVAPHTSVDFYGVGKSGSATLGFETALSVQRKEVWDVLPGSDGW